MDISIIVVSYNTRRLVEDCLLSVERHLDGRLDYELIVVDNASKDGTPEWLDMFAADRPRLHVRHAGANLGFSGGNNAGLEISRGRYVLYLNSDAYLVDDSLAGMLAYLDAHPEAGLASCMLLTGDGKPGPSYGCFPTPAILAKELLTRNFNRLRAVCPAPEEATHEVDFPCGAFFLINGELARELRGMDTAFFMYFEETDLAKRALDLGHKCVYIGGAKAVHLGGQSTQEVKSLFLTRMFYANWKRYLLKHHGVPASAAVRCMLGAYFAAARIAHRIRGDSGIAAFFGNHGRALSEGWSQGAGAPP